MEHAVQHLAQQRDIREKQCWLSCFLSLSLRGWYCTSTAASVGFPTLPHVARATKSIVGSLVLWDGFSVVLWRSMLPRLTCKPRTSARCWCRPCRWKARPTHIPVLLSGSDVIAISVLKWACLGYADLWCLAGECYWWFQFRYASRFHSVRRCLALIRNTRLLWNGGSYTLSPRDWL